MLQVKNYGQAGLETVFEGPLPAGIKCMGPQTDLASKTLEGVQTISLKMFPGHTSWLLPNAPDCLNLTLENYHGPEQLRSIFPNMRELTLVNCSASIGEATELEHVTISSKGLLGKKRIDELKALPKLARLIVAISTEGGLGKGRIINELQATELKGLPDCTALSVTIFTEGHLSGEQGFELQALPNLTHLTIVTPVNQFFPCPATWILKGCEHLTDVHLVGCTVDSWQELEGLKSLRLEQCVLPEQEGELWDRVSPTTEFVLIPREEQEAEKGVPCGQ